MARKEYTLTQLGGKADGTADIEANNNEGPVGFLAFCEDLDELPTPPPDLIKKEGERGKKKDLDDDTASTASSSSESSQLTKTKHSRRSIFGKKKEKA